MTSITSVSNTQNMMAYTNSSTKVNNAPNLLVQKMPPQIDAVHLSEKGVRLQLESASILTPDDKNDSKELQINFREKFQRDALARGAWTGRMEKMANRADGHFYSDFSHAVMDSLMSGFDGDKVYEDALKRGMSEDEALEFKEKEYKEFYKEANHETKLLAYKFAINTDAEPGVYKSSDVFDENFNFKVPYKYTPSQYKSALQDVFDKAMEHVKSNPNSYPLSSGKEFKINFEIEPWS